MIAAATDPHTRDRGAVPSMGSEPCSTCAAPNDEVVVAVRDGDDITYGVITAY